MTSHLSILQKDYTKGLMLKNQGNEYYRAEDYKLALKCYSHVFLEIGMNSSSSIQSLFTATGMMSNDSSSSATTENQESLKSINSKIFHLRISTLNNMAMAYMVTHEWQKLIEKCDQVLKHSPYDFKALFRKSRGLRHLTQYYPAKKILEVLQKMYANDFKVKNELALIEREDCTSDDIIIKMEETNSGIMKYFNSSKMIGMWIMIAIVIISIVIALYFNFYNVENESGDVLLSEENSNLNVSQNSTI